MKHKLTNMQKTWNIFHESDSPNSASSTDANYSSPSGENSSDDSNCSNQTNYSMSTGVMASPPASIGSTSSSSPISSTSSEDSPPPPPPPPAQAPPTTTPPIPTNQNPTPPAQPVVKENKENPPFNYVTTPQLAETTLQRIKQRYCTPPDNNGNNSETAMRSLELLRMTVQSSFDKDIDGIIRNYIEIYFKPAFSNIKENLGDTAVSEEVLLKMSCALLENAKTQYHGLRMRAAAASYYFSETVQPQTEQSTTSTETSSQIRTAVKRHMATSVSSASSTTATATTTTTTTTTNTAVSSTPPQKRAFSSISTKKEAPNPITITNQQTQSATERRMPNSAPLPPSNFQPFRGTALPNQTNNSTARRQIFWNTANVSITTKFVLDVQANQAFGFGTDGRERLASKHPELIRYLPDAEDRNWLINQHIITQHNRNSRFLFLVYDEVCNLLRTHENYHNKTNINMSIMRTFVVPEFMIEKMRHFFVDLNIKSRGLITTSNTNTVTEANTSGNSGSSSSCITITTNANTSATTNNNTTSITTSTTNTTSTFVTTGNQFVGNSNNSQLRTALLQGQGQAQTSQAQLNLFNEDTLMSNASNDYVTTTTTFNESPNLSNFSAAFQQPPKTSALSSTHATLTALLNNSSSPAVPPLSRTYMTAQIGGTPKNATTQVTSSSNATIKINTVPYGNTTTTSRNITAAHTTATATTTSNNINRNHFIHPVSRQQQQQQQLPQTITSATLPKSITVHTTSNVPGKVTVSTALPTNFNRNNTTTSTTMINTTRNNLPNNNCRPITSQPSSSSLVRNNNFATLNTINSTSRNNNVQGNVNAINNRNTNSVPNVNPNVVSFNRNPIRNARGTTNRK